MSLHQQEYSYFRLANLDDIKYLAPRLRYEDKQEILATNGRLPYYELLRGYKQSKIIFTIVNQKDKPVGIFGIDDLGGSVGGIWLVATDELATIQITFLRQCRQVVEFLNTKYKILWNYVDCRNDVHIKWLKWCGFKFINKKNYGVLNKPFYEFIRICVHQQQD
tara:strand:+ start:148 stop:639 length:492 start_codon:yes stop_codon:yes gene_type:complete